LEISMNVTTLATPAGELTILANDAGEVLASGFTNDVGKLLSLVHPSVRTSAPRRRPDLGAVTTAVLSYLDGDLSALDEVPVRQYSGGQFLGPAWDALRQVKPGRPISYTALATLAGRPAAVRAAAQTCARNAATLFVPCHRIVRTDGSLGGYRWGLPVKRWLLRHEAESL
jgi:methylated-DNA-[protein]-cysteine S-methyltransferase